MKKIENFVFRVCVLGGLFYPFLVSGMLSIRSKMPCSMRRAEECRKETIYLRDKKDGCAHSRTNCLKHYCIANCANTTCSNANLCRDCTSVYLGEPWQSNLKKCLKEEKILTKNDVLQIMPESDSSLKQQENQKVQRVIHSQFQRDMQEYESLMKEYTKLNIKTFKELELADEWDHIDKEEKEMFDNLSAKYQRDPVRWAKVEAMRAHYGEIMQEGHPLMRQIKNLFGYVQRSFKDFFGPQYDPKTTIFDPSTS